MSVQKNVKRVFLKTEKKHWNVLSNSASWQLGYSLGESVLLTAEELDDVDAVMIPAACRQRWMSDARRTVMGQITDHTPRRPHCTHARAPAVSHVSASQHYHRVGGYALPQS